MVFQKGIQPQTASHGVPVRFMMGGNNRFSVGSVFKIFNEGSQGVKTHFFAKITSGMPIFRNRSLHAYWELILTLLGIYPVLFTFVY
jgi:hypothetical protein